MLLTSIRQFVKKLTAVNTMASIFLNIPNKLRKLSSFFMHTQHANVQMNVEQCEKERKNIENTPQRNEHISYGCVIPKPHGMKSIFMKSYCVDVCIHS